MAGAYSSSSMKLKRKELDEVSDDFSDFSLSSPARKIRRLDAELPPIMEEEEPEIPMVYGQPVSEEQQVSSTVIEELPSVPFNEERAIVLFKPVNTAHLLQSSSNLSVSVDSNVLSGLKDQFFRSRNSGMMKSAEDEEALRNKNKVAAKECLAVVPWVPSQLPNAPGMELFQNVAPELVEDEEMGTTTMDIEEENNESMEEGCENQSFPAMWGTEGLHHWQQQHCMIPQLPQNTSTPVTWFW